MNTTKPRTTNTKDKKKVSSKYEWQRDHTCAYQRLLGTLEMDQKEFCKIIDYSQCLASRFINGLAEPTQAVLDSILTHFAVDTNCLVENTDLKDCRGNAYTRQTYLDYKSNKAIILDAKRREEIEGHVNNLRSLLLSSADNGNLDVLEYITKRTHTKREVLFSKLLK